MDNSSTGIMSVQWHITSRCGNRCRHCYMYESERYKTEIENECSYEQLIEILDNIKDFEDTWGFKINDFFITGGDPLIRKDYPEFLFKLKSLNKRINIMGNPETLTEENLKRLSEIGINQFQMSLDGMKGTHDYYRGKGSFDQTVAALELLEKHDIKGTIMFTLTGENYSELLPLLNYVAYNTKAKGFAFDLVCGVGNAKNISAQLTKECVKVVFEDYLLEKKRIKESGKTIQIAEKPKFFKLLHYDNNDFYPYNYEGFNVASGCYVGYTCYTILSDGSVAACRRFPTTIGKMPEQKMEDIFLENPLLKLFRRSDSYESCGMCKLYKYCRGCPAVTFGYAQNAFAKNPLCFSELIEKPLDNHSNPVVKLNTSKEEEASLIKSLLINQYVNDYNDFIANDDVLILIGTLLSDKVERKRFFTNPDAYVTVNKYTSLHSKYIAYVCYYVDCVLLNKISNPIRYVLDVF